MRKWLWRWLTKAKQGRAAMPSLFHAHKRTFLSLEKDLQKKVADLFG
jgi:hypothetical protein